MKRQVVVVHGGDSFKTRREYLSFLRNCRMDFERYKSGRKDWKSNLGKALGRKFEVILPAMPDRNNAKYDEWKVWFEKLIPHLRPGVVLVGHSLGGLFLAKYLSEKIFPKKMRAIFLVAAPFGHGDFTRPKTLKKLEKQAGRIFIYQSVDDRVVPLADFKKYRDELKSAVARVFRAKGHFNQKNFPELSRDIGELYRLRAK